ncbi:MAG TPA: hypothetical protein VGC57_14875 [Cellulomonas sp.]
MHTPAAGAPRLLRALGVVSLVVALGAVAHLLGGGHLPSAGVLAVLGVLLLPVAVLACGWRLRAVTVAALLGAGQLVLHHVLRVVTACAPSRDSMGGSGPTTGGAALRPTGAVGPVDAAASTGAADHLLHGATALHLTTSCPHESAASAPLLGGAAMLVLHALATLVTALLVAGADRRVWRRLRGRTPVAVLLLRLRAALRATGLEIHGPLEAPDLAGVPRPHGTHLRTRVRRRGPPDRIDPGVLSLAA